jgi:hypothetical protein
MSSPTKQRNPPTVNGREMKNEEDVKTECAGKGHDLICPKSWYRLMLLQVPARDCVKTFSALEPNTAYESVRSEEMAYRLHREKVEKGIMDLEPIAPAIKWMGIGIGVGSAGFGLGHLFQSVAFLVQSFKK